MPESTPVELGGRGPVRPGAMTTVMRAVRPTPSGPRWVRYAVVRDGRIEKEAVRGPDEEVVVGAEGDVPVRGERELSLLRFEGGAWRLRVRAGWGGRTKEGPLSDAAPRDGLRELRLEGDGRAKIVIGDVAVLVQLVDRPPARTKPQLPSALKRGLMGGTDWTFSSFVAASFFLHFALVVFVVEADWPVETQLIPDRVAGAIFIEPAPPPDAPPMDDALADRTEPTDAPPSDAQPSDRPPSDAQPARRPQRVSSIPSPGSAESQPSIDEQAREAARQAENILLGLEDASSAMGALIDQAPTERAEEILRGVEGNRVATNDVGVMQERPGSGPPGGGDLGPRPLRGLRGNGLRPQPSGPPLEERVVTVVSTPPNDDWITDPVDPDFDPRLLHTALRGRMGAVRGCYERELTRGNPNLAGRMRVRMTVQSMGNLSNVRVVDNTTGSDSLASCVEGAVRRVRLRSGPRTPLDAEYPLVFARQD